MINRLIEPDILQSLRQFPAVALLGPRQAGKTTLAKRLLKNLPHQQKAKGIVYLDLELSSDLAKLEDAESYLQPLLKQCVVIDEIQRRPQLFPVLRALIDQNRCAGRFLILGSASPSLIRQASESLAGRIDYRELTPFLRPEIHSKVSLRQHLWRGGFPESTLARNDPQARRWQEAFIRSYLERDLPELGIRISSSDLRRFWMMLAHQHGQIWNAQTLAGSLGVSGPTVRHYLSIFEQTYIIRVLQPWHPNLKKRLIKAPKIYLRDSGLFHALLSLPSYDSLQGHPLLGASWEGYVLEQLAGVLRNQVDIYFYRTHAGSELDFVLVKGLQVVGAVEVKCSRSAQVTRGFHESRTDLGNPPTWIVYQGDENFSLSKDVHVTTLDYFLKEIVSFSRRHSPSPNKK